jgi:hypothetical protein
MGGNTKQKPQSLPFRFFMLTECISCAAREVQAEKSFFGRRPDGKAVGDFIRVRLQPLRVDKAEALDGASAGAHEIPAENSLSRRNSSRSAHFNSLDPSRLLFFYPRPTLSHDPPLRACAKKTEGDLRIYRP